MPPAHPAGAPPGAPQRASQGAPRAQTTNGAVQGLTLASGVRTFRGIPYAAPPVPDLRWRPPQPVQGWRGVRPADRFEHQCLQARPFGDMMFRNAGGSEDRLYLNVWTPPAANAASASSRTPSSRPSRPSTRRATTVDADDRHLRGTRATHLVLGPRAGRRVASMFAVAAPAARPGPGVTRDAPPRASPAGSRPGSVRSTAGRRAGRRSAR